MSHTDVPPPNPMLRLATLNCLHDLKDPELLQHAIRHDAILRELHALNADVIGLNEVTVPLLERVLREPWVRDNYFVSAVPDDPRCAHVSTCRAGVMGNLLLSRIPPFSVEYVAPPGANRERLDGRHTHVMTFSFCADGSSSRLFLSVCSVHFTAFPWLHEGRRRAQLHHLVAVLDRAWGQCVAPTAGVLMGDFNFHRESENRNIPEEWGEIDAVVAQGHTWDMKRNPMLPHYLPLRHMYNGFGLLGGWLRWPSPMRLDRVLVRGAPAGSLGVGEATARIFADKPIHERARGRAALPLSGTALQEAHRKLPWEEYLACSDHFGIVVDLPLCF